MLVLRIAFNTLNDNFSAFLPETFHFILAWNLLKSTMHIFFTHFLKML